MTQSDSFTNVPAPTPQPADTLDSIRRLGWPGFEMHGDQGPMFKALATARAAFTEIKKTKLNPFFNSKYADLADVLDATMPAYSAAGLTLNQLPTRPVPGGDWTVYTILGHESGAFWLLQATIPAAEWQKFGSALTYCRRYVDSAVLGVASEPDDDGNEADDKRSGPRANTQATPPSAPKQAKPAPEKPASAPKAETKPEPEPKAFGGATPAQEQQRAPTQPPPPEEKAPDLGKALAEQELSPRIAPISDAQNAQAHTLFLQKVWPRKNMDTGTVEALPLNTGDPAFIARDRNVRRMWLKEVMGIADPGKQLTSAAQMAEVIKTLEALPNKATT